MGEIVSNCFARGLDTFDLMAPGDAYKFEWADRSVQVGTYVVSQSINGKIALMLGHGMRDRVKRAYSGLPYALRKRIHATLSPMT